MTTDTANNNYSDQDQPKIESQSCQNNPNSTDRVITSSNAYNTDWDSVEECDLSQCENIMRQALVDWQLEDYQRRDILFKYGRRRQSLLHYPTNYTQELRAQTIQMNNHLSQKCIQAGKIMTDLIRMANARGLDPDKLLMTMDVRVSSEQPWDADDLERAMVSEVMDYNLVVKSFYNNDNPKEYTVRNKILGLSDDDDNWNECLPTQWSAGMQLTFPFDRIRDGIPLSWERITQIRNYDLIIEETFSL